MSINQPPGFTFRGQFVGSSGDDFTFKANPDDVQEALEYFKPDIDYIIHVIAKKKDEPQV